MGPMVPRGLGPWAPGALGPNYENLGKSKICQKMLLRTSNEPQDTSQMVLKNFGNLSKTLKFWVRAVCPTTRLRKVIGQLQPLLLALRRSLRGFFFRQKQRPKKNVYLLKNEVVMQIFVIFPNVDLNLRLNICKIVVQSSVRTFTYTLVPKRRVSKSQYERIPTTFFFDLPMKSYDTRT